MKLGNDCSCEQCEKTASELKDGVDVRIHTSGVEFMGIRMHATKGGMSINIQALSKVEIEDFLEGVLLVMEDMDRESLRTDQLGRNETD